MFNTTARRAKLLLPATAAALLALSGAAFAQEGNGDPFSVMGKPQVFAVGAPRLDQGSQAYPTTAGQGAGWAGGVNHVTRDRVPAYQQGFDTGSEAYPTPR